MKLQDCADRIFLALMVWREARGESSAVQTGIAYVVMNRVRRPSWWGSDVMGVVFKKWQFSSLTDPKDRQLTTWPDKNDPSWAQCLRIAWAVVDGTTVNPAAGSDSYYDTSIAKPAWAVAEKFVAQIGRVRFYNLDSDVEI